jgi:hypothetical protein
VDSCTVTMDKCIGKLPDIESRPCQEGTHPWSISNGAVSIPVVRSPSFSRLELYIPHGCASKHKTGGRRCRVGFGSPALILRLRKLGNEVPVPEDRPDVAVEHRSATATQPQGQKTENKRVKSWGAEARVVISGAPGSRG